jgi:EmrB/QacA subfamily drug resistance transporter
MNDATPTELPVPDPRRWITLVIILSAVLIAALDTTVLNVAIPTILRDFHTTLPKLQWVITGYSLTFAALLIIGGRLADIHGARKIFMIGAGLFAVGSLVAALSTGVVSLVIGEAVIEGMGASLMLPATLGILTSSFQGRERATAFAAWGAVMGAAVALGPLLGGFLTTNYSWRWGFRINVIVAPLAILGAMVVMPRVPTTGRRERIDWLGAALISSGMFLLVFGISEGASYGWWSPLRAFGVAGADIWPTSMPISPSVVAFALAAVLLVAFYRVQVAKERARTDPLFEFSNLERPAFRWGIVTLLLLAMGQVAFLFVLSVVLQDGHHLSAVTTGLWLVPPGLFIVVSSQIGGWLTRFIGTTTVVRMGLVIQTCGLAATAIAVRPDLTFASLLPGFAMFGIGIGFAGSQLNNVILAEVPAERSGAASGANSTVRMIGASLGIAIISSLLSMQTIRHAVDAVQHADSLPPDLRLTAADQIRSSGVNFSSVEGMTRGQATLLRELVDRAVSTGARTPLVFATVVVAVGAVVSLLIPRVGPFAATARSEVEDDDVQVEVRAESAALAEAAAH